MFRFRKQILSKSNSYFQRQKYGFGYRLYGSRVAISYRYGKRRRKGWRADHGIGCLYAELPRFEKRRVQPFAGNKKLVRIIKEGAEYGLHVLLYSLTWQGVTEILETGVLNEFENRIALDSGKSMGVITEQTGTKISEKGSALLQGPDEFTTYNPDLIRVYSQFKITEKSDDIDFIDNLLKIGL